MTWLLISAGAFVGAPTRYLTDRAVQARFGSTFPWGTLIVNVVASFVLGMLLGPGAATDANLAAGLGVGFCGALSTYSTFSYETLRLYERRQRGLAVLNVMVSLVVGIGAAGLGWAVGATLF